jgi:methylmalonyl-CoA/ethylmalonyl-CoA epimerase
MMMRKGRRAGTRWRLTFAAALFAADMMDTSLKFDHLGVVVPSLDEGRAHLSAALEIPYWSREFADPLNGVFVQFGRDPLAMCYELVAPLGENSPVALALRKGQVILNHVAYRVEALESQVNRLRNLRFRPLGSPKPAVAYEGRNIQFLMSPLNFIVELIEHPKHAHAFSKLAIPAVS